MYQKNIQVTNMKLIQAIHSYFKWWLHILPIYFHIAHIISIYFDIAHINKMGWYVPAAQDFSPIKNNEWPTHWKNFSAISPFLSSYHNTQRIVPILQSDLCKFCRDSKRYILSLGWAFHLIWSLCYKPRKYQIMSTLHDTPCFPQEILKTDNIFSPNSS